MTTNEFTSSWTDDALEEEENLLGWWADSKVVVNPVLHSGLPKSPDQKFTQRPLQLLEVISQRSFLFFLLVSPSVSLSLSHSLTFVSLSLQHSTECTIQGCSTNTILTDFFSLFSSLGLRKLKLSLFLFKVDCFFSVLGRVSVVRGTLDVYAPLDPHNRTV